MPVTNAQDMAKAGSLINSDGTTVSVAADLLIADKLVHTGDTNTAIRFPAADTVTVETSGTERMRIDSSGNVGIGTSNPAQRLHVQTGTNKDIRVFNATHASLANLGSAISFSRQSDGAQNISAIFGIENGGLAIAGREGLAFCTGGVGFYSDTVERLRIDSSGRVGIGTSSPSYPMDIVADSNAFALNVRGRSVDNLGYIRFSTNNGATNHAAVGTPALSTLALDTNGSERLRITSGGEVYIAGTTDQGAYNLQVNGTGVWGAGAYVNGSDERLKENIQDITSGLDVVEKLRPVSFQYKEEYTADRSVQSGFIAQDLLVALDGKNYLEGVVSQGPTYYNVAYQNLIPILAKAIQELKTINNSQAQTITSLESRITALEAA